MAFNFQHTGTYIATWRYSRAFRTTQKHGRERQRKNIHFFHLCKRYIHVMRVYIKSKVHATTATAEKKDYPKPIVKVTVRITGNILCTNTHTRLYIRRVPVRVSRCYFIFFLFALALYSVFRDERMRSTMQCILLYTCTYTKHNVKRAKRGNPIFEF